MSSQELFAPGLHPQDALKARVPVPWARVWRWKIVADRPIPIEFTADVAEVVRKSLMRTARARTGSHHLPPDLYPEESARYARAGRQSHSHAFILPEDFDTDGDLDHVRVVSPSVLGGRGFSRDGLALLAGCLGFYLEGFGDIELQPVGLSPACPFGSDAHARVWRSLTPFAPPLSDGAPHDLISRTLAELALPAPSAIRSLGDAVRLGGRFVRGPDFAPTGDAAERFRPIARRSTDLAWWEIEFPRPVPGPILIGGLCHFGLGRFAAADA